MKKLHELVQENVQLFKLSEHFKKYSLSKKKLPLVTISRETGSGGKPVADLVCKKLGSPWQVYHKDIVDAIAKDARLEKQLISKVDENKLPVIEQFISDIFGQRYISLNTYQQHLVKILSAIGSRGYAIIVGRGGAYLFEHALKVRIICEMEQRIIWEMQYEKISRKQAITRIQTSDIQRYEFEKALYSHDIKKAHHYDLVIRTGKQLSITQAADIIVLAIRQRFGL